MLLDGDTHELCLRVPLKTRCKKLDAHENGRVLQLQQQCSRFHSRPLPEASWSLSWGSPRNEAAIASGTAHECRSNAVISSDEKSRIARGPDHPIRRRRSRKMGGWRVLPRGEVMSASVADTRVDLVSSSTFDVPLVILAESDVLDRSIFSVRPPIPAAELKSSDSAYIVTNKQ